MTILLILLAGAGALELLTYIFGKAQWLRQGLAMLAIALGGFAAGGLATYSLHLFSILIAIISLYRIFNMMRVLEGRMHERYLRGATLRTTSLLLGFQIILFLGWRAWSIWHATGAPTWSVLAAAQFFVATVLLVSIHRNLKKTAWPKDAHQYSDRELPTLTVAIPARNETEDLQRCLQSVVASTYPKLEVIVLDDCSQLKRTPEIIKDFAQDGVRFVQGEQPSDTWLPKNQAYDRLVREASGQYVLFCGVDARFETDSIRKIVTTMLSRNKKMMCILPRREMSAYAQTSLIQAMRYWWELVPPRRLFKRPPVISSCWVIEKTALKQAGGFKAVTRSIMPEAHFARELIGTDSYSFLRSNQYLGITSNKQAGEQFDTAVRMRYPQLHRRPEQVMLFGLFQVAFLVAPFAMAIAGFWIAIGAFAHVMAILTSILLTITYERSVISTHVNSVAVGLVALPFTVLTDLYLVHYSMFKYELSTVDWKGRNICIPAMHVVPYLPKLPD